MPVDQNQKATIKAYAFCSHLLLGFYIVAEKMVQNREIKDGSREMEEDRVVREREKQKTTVERD